MIIGAYREIEGRFINVPIAQSAERIRLFRLGTELGIPIPRHISFQFLHGPKVFFDVQTSSTVTLTGSVYRLNVDHDLEGAIPGVMDNVALLR